MTLAAPGFHHLHLNSVDPGAAIEFYVRQFPRSAKAEWGGLPALTIPVGLPSGLTTGLQIIIKEPQSAVSRWVLERYAT